MAGSAIQESVALDYDFNHEGGIFLPRGRHQNDPECAHWLEDG